MFSTYPAIPLQELKSHNGATTFFGGDARRMFSHYAHHNSGKEGKEENSSLISARYPWALGGGPSSDGHERSVNNSSKRELDSG